VREQADTDLELESAGPAMAPTIQTVQRAALILGSFTVREPRLSLNEITARLGASKATAHRYTKALRAANLLRYDERTALYSLGPQVLTLAAAASAGMPIVSVAEPYMERLVKEIDQTIVLTMWNGEAPTVVRCADNTNGLVRISIRAGSRLALADSAQGRIFCAYLPADQLPRELPRLLRKQPELRDEIEAVRANGGLSVNSPDVNGVRTVAAPVFDDDTVIAAMAIVGTMVTVSEDPDSPMARKLLDTTRELSRRLGGGVEATGSLVPAS
jgi:DNA-binding IclR family transcriptional regulator